VTLGLLNVGRRNASPAEGAGEPSADGLDQPPQTGVGGWVPPRRSTFKNATHMLRAHWRLIAATVALLIISAILREQYANHTGGFWHGLRAILIDVGLAVSGALIVALVVGFLIDVEARYGLAQEIAEGWLWGLLGKDAPESLQLRAKEIIGNRIVLNLNEAIINLDWEEHPQLGRVLKVEARSLAMGTNFGPEAWREQPSTRVIPSIPGRTSKVTHWEFEVQHADSSMPAGHFLLEGADLKSKSYRDLGTIHYVDGADLEIPENLAAHRGDRFRLLRKAEFWLLEADTLPLSSRAPSVSTKLVVTGSAVPDLDIHVLTSRAEAGPMAGDQDPEGNLVFDGKARLSGEWWWLCWTPKTPAAADAAGSNGGEPQAALAS
jgi:hypothetical protein